MRTKTKATGFTLIEIMMVIVVIGIIVAVAMPSYTRQTLKSYRSEAYAALNEIMQAQERYAVEEGTYTIDLTEMGYVDRQPSDTGRYRISAAACGDGITQCVILSAVAQGPQAEDRNDAEDSNGNGNLHEDITLTSQGVREFW